MKKLGEVMIYIPFVWYFLLLGYYAFFTEAGDHLLNPFVFLSVFLSILMIPLTWILIIIGLIGYLIHEKSDKGKREEC